MIHGPDPYAPAVEDKLFVYTTEHGWSGKVRCVVCGKSGYPGCKWQRPHRAGHSPCPDCGTQLTLKKDGTPRKHNRHRRLP